MTMETPDPLPASTDALVDQITELAAHIHAATYRLLILIRELDRRRVWADHGCNSCAHWLNWQCGIGLNAAREKVRVAHALETLPEISEAFRQGIISYSKVRAMSRVATPENEADLMNVAYYGTAAHVEKLTRYYRRAKEAEALEAANDRHEKRGLHWYYDDDGMLVIQCRLDPEDGARFLKGLGGTVEALREEDPGDVTAETRAPGVIPGFLSAAHRADALVRMAETVIANGVATPPPGERFEVTVHIDAGSLTGEAPGGMSETDDARPLCSETVRRLGCDAALVGLVVDGDGEPLNVGRRTRAIPPTIKRALNARDRGCRFPGCNYTRFVEGHHVKHWARGGETKLNNLVTLCGRHHRLVHEGGFSVEAVDTGGFCFRDPRGEPIPDAGTFPRKRGDRVAALMEENRRCGLDIDAQTGASNWGGETMDYDVAIHALFEADGGFGVPKTEITSVGQESPH